VAGYLTPRQRGIGMTSERTRARMVEYLREQGIRDETVLAAMARVPRHLFVEDAFVTRAYDDVPLPIGSGQTISSTYVVARMAELLRNGRDLGRVLEIGAGCGYQAAVLSCIAREVVSIERVVTLVGKARRNLREARVANVKLKHGDGMQALAGEAPFDGIISAAATPTVPQAWFDQLAVGGRLVLPLGASMQHIVVYERGADGIEEQSYEGVKFVPLLPGLA
jgi:protein-L-isoaspartate(D-aspartate) O-methyltransferase